MYSDFKVGERVCAYERVPLLKLRVDNDDVTAAQCNRYVVLFMLRRGKDGMRARKIGFGSEIGEMKF
jgi:hypothetical protein